MRITVCELPDESARRERAWTDLVRYLHASPTDIVVLPEMPFCDWEMFRKRSVDLVAWRAALAAHDTMMTRLGELQARMVLASRPVEIEGRAKFYPPDEPDGWEASWFDRGDREFPPEAPIHRS
jgi:N-carbamoylputrescine amidase